MDDKSPLKEAWSGSRDPPSILMPAIARAKARGRIYKVLAFKWKTTPKSSPASGSQTRTWSPIPVLNRLSVG